MCECVFSCDCVRLNVFLSVCVSGCVKAVWDGGCDGMQWTGLCGRGLFLACEDFGRMFDHSFPACAFFSLSFFLSGD